MSALEIGLWMAENPGVYVLNKKEGKLLNFAQCNKQIYPVFHENTYIIGFADCQLISTIIF